MSQKLSAKICKECHLPFAPKCYWQEVCNRNNCQSARKRKAVKRWKAENPSRVQEYQKAYRLL